MRDIRLHVWQILAAVELLLTEQSDKSDLLVELATACRGDGDLFTECVHTVRYRGASRSVYFSVVHTIETLSKELGIKE
jgi:hypothetical protein